MARSAGRHYDCAVPLVISRADFADPALAEFLRGHLADMEPTAPPESQHGLDLDALRAPETRLWVGHLDGELLVTGALVALPDVVADGHDEEVKTMRTAPAARGKGLARAMLTHLLADAAERGVPRLWLETGSQPFFAASRELYRSVGFTECDPFGSYQPDPNSTFMTTTL